MGTVVRKMRRERLQKRCLVHWSLMWIVSDVGGVTRPCRGTKRVDGKKSCWLFGRTERQRESAREKQQRQQLKKNSQQSRSKKRPQKPRRKEWKRCSCKRYSERKVERIHVQNKTTAAEDISSVQVVQVWKAFNIENVVYDMDTAWYSSTGRENGKCYSIPTARNGERMT